jgi:hypothetical protein
MRVEDLEKALKSHDWLYQYADDFRVWNRGHEQKANINRLMHIASKEGWGDKAKELYQKYKK